jgi:predicted transcriptional regulator
MGNKGRGPAPVIPIGAAKGKKPLSGRVKKESEKKWGRAVMARGFQIVPSILLRGQARLGLDSRQLTILLHLADHWWEAERDPYPSKKTLASRMGLTPRQVQRAIAAMETAGLVARVPRYAAQGGRLNNAYDLSGLVARLKEMEPVFRKADEEAKARRRAAERPGRRAAASPE